MLDFELRHAALKRPLAHVPPALKNIAGEPFFSVFLISRKLNIQYIYMYSTPSEGPQW